MSEDYYCEDCDCPLIYCPYDFPINAEYWICSECEKQKKVEPNDETEQLNEENNAERIECDSEK